jgi:hypothetical protein
MVTTSNPSKYSVITSWIVTSLFIILALASFFAALYGLGIRYQKQYQNALTALQSEGIDARGFLSEQAKIVLPELSPIRNFVDLTFRSETDSGNTSGSVNSSASGNSSGLVSIGVCGEKITEFVAAPIHSLTVPLEGACNPLTLELSILKVAGQESAPLRVTNLEISSFLGVPILRMEKVITYGLAILLLAMIIVFVPNSIPLSWLSVLIPPVSFLLLANRQGFDLNIQIEQWWICLAAAVIALCATRLYRSTIGRCS